MSYRTQPFPWQAKIRKGPCNSTTPEPSQSVSGKRKCQSSEVEGEGPCKKSHNSVPEGVDTSDTCQKVIQVGDSMMSTREARDWLRQQSQTPPHMEAYIESLTDEEFIIHAVQAEVDMENFHRILKDRWKIWKSESAKLNSLQVEYDKLKAAHQNEKEDLRANFKRQTNELKAAYEREIEDLRASFNRQTNELKAANQKEKEDLIANQKEKENLIATFKRQTEELKTANQKEKAAIQKEKEDLIATFKRQTEELKTANQKENTEDFRAAFKRQTDELKAANQKEKEELRAAFNRQTTVMHDLRDSLSLEQSHVEILLKKNKKLEATKEKLIDEYRTSEEFGHEVLFFAHSYAHSAHGVGYAEALKDAKEKYPSLELSDFPLFNPNAEEESQLKILIDEVGWRPSEHRAAPVADNAEASGSKPADATH